MPLMSRKRKNSNSDKKPVFADPTRHRRVFVRAIGYSLLAILTIWLTTFSFSIYSVKPLPESALDDPDQFAAPVFGDLFPSGTPATVVDGSSEIDATILGLASHDTPYTIQRAAPNKVFAFVPNWPQQGLLSLEKNLDNIDVILPEWFSVNLETGEMFALDEYRQIQVEEFIEENARQQAILPLIQGFEALSHVVLAKEGLRQQLTEVITKTVIDNGYDGVCLDFRWATSAAMQEILGLISELRGLFTEIEKQICVVIQLRPGLWPFSELEQHVDNIIFTSITHPSLGDLPAPIASHQEFTTKISEILVQIDRTKAVFAFGNLGFDWSSDATSAVPVHFSEIARLSGFHQKPIVFDPVSLNSSLTFVDAKSQRHQIWFTDAITAHNQLVALGPEAIGGVAIHPLGGEDPGIWQLLGSRVRPEDLLRILSVENYVGYVGEGELLTAFGDPQPGIRSLVTDPDSGLIISQTYLQRPQAFTVVRWGAGDPHEIVLTFDDGPNAEFTPQILDILKEKNVPAAFFVLGKNALATPELIKRTYDEGHEIGLHTFFHPNISTSTDARLMLEVNSTQRLLASMTGRNTILFRAPFGEAMEPQTGEEVEPILKLSLDGYLSVGMLIDSKDWTRPGSEKIVQRVIDGARAGDGNVVVLHDGGFANDRTQTVTALPEIIDTLRSEGFTFVSLADLMGQEREDLMPRASERMLIWDRLSFGALVSGKYFLSIAYMATVILGGGRMVIILLMVFFRRRHAPPADGYDPPVTVIIPAFNEEPVIIATIESILASDYPDLKLIIVDDGSTDETYNIVQRAYSDNPCIKVVHQSNQGKSNALNYGYTLADTEIIVATDADTLVLPDAIRLLVRHFADPQVGAVAGNAKVGNRINILTRLQAIEYITSQNLDRRVLGMFNSIFVVPGAIGAWRKDVVQNVGGYSPETLTEDADLTVSIIRSGFRVKYENGAIALTEAPETVRQLMRQRLRWKLGGMQVGWKHRGAIRERKGIGLIGIPNLVIFGITLHLFAPILDIVFITAVLQFIWDVSLSTTVIPSLTIAAIIATFGFYILLEVALTAVVLSLEPTEDKRLIFWVVFQRFIYRQILYITVFRSLTRAMTGQLSGWHKVTRTASVVAPAGPLSRHASRRVDLHRVTRKT